LVGARQNFYAGRLTEAEASLTNVVPRPKDKVLFLMERGTIRQQRGEYSESSRDYIAASAEIERLWTISASKGAASFVINDSVQDFRGAPYERTLLEVFNAHNFLAQGDWDNAAVGARRVIRSLDPDRRDNYPEDAYSRYLAGFCLAMIDDDSNAALQYRKANELASHATIDPLTGRVTHKAPVSTNATKNAEAPLMPPIQPVPAGSNTAELVCFVLTGRAPPADADPAIMAAFSFHMYAEIRHQGKVLGRSYVLADTGELARKTAEKDAVANAIKTGIRVGIKAALAVWAEQQKDGLGMLVFQLLMALEEPDVRRWETLPQQLQVARVSCPPDLKEFDVVFKTSGGTTMRTVHVTQPIQHRRNIYVSIIRDLTPVSVHRIAYTDDDRSGQRSRTDVPVVRTSRRMMYRY
ncbi:MAG: hypothetical protein NTY53_23355, partial [Kiritimatiellaeota bacterium]|nr:hypothetical protein [Kiritimatiellota bacterium]